jgi:hypothetical protein
MPDYRELPASLQEFEHQLGDPFEKSGETPDAAGKEHAHG